MRLNASYWIPIAFFAVLAVASAVFSPGLSGPFILDDFVHLPKLGAYGGVDNFDALANLVLTHPSATGRPLAFLSLLINDYSWPTDPYSFKYTNLCLHLLNGVLVFTLARNLLLLLVRSDDRYSSLSENNRIDYIALTTMAVWLLHPLQISTMMLVIQRMTLLMGLFTFAGLNLYCWGRGIINQRPLKAYCLMSLGVGLCGVLGALCKETAVMLVMYVVAIEFALRPVKVTSSRGPWFAWLAIFIGVPILGIIWYFFHDIAYMHELYAKREFNMQERLLSESRVLLDYIRLIVIPGMTGGPFHDDFEISKGLLTPITTLFSVFAIACSLVVAVVYRKRFVLLSFAFLWFFLSHSLESTVLPLELYFEHRNYVPMFGFVFSACTAIYVAREKIRRILSIAVLAFIGLEVAISSISSKHWGNEAYFANFWAIEHPKSVRAQYQAVRFWLRFNDFNNIEKHLQMAINADPDFAGTYLFRYAVFTCHFRIPYPDVDKIYEVLPKSTFGAAAAESLKMIYQRKKRGRCVDDNFDTELKFIDLLLENPHYKNVNMIVHNLNSTKANIYHHLRKLNQAMDALDAAYEAYPRYMEPLSQAYYLASAGLFDDAFKYIEKARNTKPYTRYVATYQQDRVDEAEEFIKKMREQAMSGEDEEKAIVPK